MEKIIIDHLEQADKYKSVLKGIDFSEDNLRKAKDIVRKFFKNHNVKLRARWRGVRNHHKSHNIKSEAVRFDLYVYA